ncbi:TrfB-related DNA-binding protein (plasmid) [Pseudomonas silesiensis]|uniref:TrfB-related DNA-binding protein n=1 Tax=Pseudomonas silesiensis TaxID=1853130 RepID=UPI0030CE457A
MAMTGDQYDALVKLMRGDAESAGNRAARRVLVDGISQADAMRETGATRAAISNAVRRYMDAGQLMRDVFGVKEN